MSKPLIFGPFHVIIYYVILIRGSSPRMLHIFHLFMPRKGLSMPAEQNTSSTTVSPHNTSIPALSTGRWLWFGLQSFTRSQWEEVCTQAAQWQLQGLHPKIADGINRWYDDAGLQMLKQVAEQHHLHVIPYHYCYGPQFGPQQISTEASISIWAGEVFGAVIPDIEDQYMGQYESAASFAQQVRASFHGLWMPTLYANPVTHPVPLLSLNPYMDAWLPQVYFAEWDGNAQDGINYVYPQWQHFDQLAHAQGQGGLKPILPIISLANHVAPEQVSDFITRMRDYGYIGFWHYGLYAPYASVIQHAPMPAPQPARPSPTKPAPSQPAPLSFNSDDRQVWTLCKDIPINEQSAIEQSWLRARYQRGWNFGPPLEPEHRVTRNSKSYIEQQFSAARASLDTTSNVLTWWTADGPVHV